MRAREEMKLMSSSFSSRAWKRLAGVSNCIELGFEIGKDRE